MQSVCEEQLNLISEVQELMHSPQALNLRSRVIASLGDLNQYHKKANNPHEAYARSVLYSTPSLEIMVASWTQSQECLPHDHGSSHGLVINLIGRFEETCYHWSHGTLQSNQSVFHSQEESLLDVTTTRIHSMHCKDKNGLTLHMYAPAIERMKVFDLNLRRTLTVANNCGAWIPIDPGQILAEESWNQRGLTCQS